MAERKLKRVTYDPGSYVDGFNMIYNAQSIAQYSTFGAYSLYVQILGYNWQEVKENLVGTAVTKIQKAMITDKNIRLLVLDFYVLYQLASYQKLYDKYTAGDMTPELAGKLNHQPWTNTGVFEILLNNSGNFNDIVLQAVKDGKLDFTPYNDTGDASPDWFLKYRLSPVAIPGYFGKISDMGKFTTNEETPLQKRKNEAVKDIAEHVAAALNEGTKTETLLLLADDVTARYNALKATGEAGYYNSIFPFTSERATGFAVDVAAEEIIDLRKHWKELQELLTPGAEPLKEFADMIRGILAGDVQQPPKVTARKAKRINYPVDKVNNKIWGTLERNKDGQIAFSTVKTGKNKVATILAAINFANMEGIKITKKLTSFDKRAYIAVAALWNAGNKVITLTQIHYAMGNTQRPAKYQLEKINEAISKMTTAKLFLDNAYEVEQLKYKYAKFKYDGALLPMERMTASINGQLSDAAIHIFREPPLLTFARERNQITTFDVKLLQSPVNKTDANLAIEDYLLEHIAGAKRAAAKGKKVIINTILFATLFNELAITGRMQRARAMDKIKTYLDYYKETKFIKNYVADPDKITFYF